MSALLAERGYITVALILLDYVSKQQKNTE